MIKNIDKYKIILASASPRRQQFLKDLHIQHVVSLRPVKEIYPIELKGKEIPEYLATLKARAFTELADNEIVITGDTIVWHNGNALQKPKNRKEAFEMISSLQDSSHQVISAFCIQSKRKIYTASDNTDVFFQKLSDEDIYYYIDKLKPYDKAGAYGIQDWIGQIGISAIQGSYFNVMGFPTHLFYAALQNFINT